MNDNPAAAAEHRLATLVEALGDPDPDDKEAMEELWVAQRRLSEDVAREIVKRPGLHPEARGGRIPESQEGGPPTAEQSLLWALCVRYERVAGLIEVYIGEERILTVPIASLRQNASWN